MAGNNKREGGREAGGAPGRANARPAARIR